MCGLCGLGDAGFASEAKGNHFADWSQRAAETLETGRGETEFGTFYDIPSGTGTSVGLSVGQRINAQISVQGDTDWFGMQLEAGQTYQISLRALSSGGLADPKVYLFDDTGTFLISDDDRGDGDDALLTFTATRTGVYFAGATGFGKDEQTIGNYEITLGEANFDDDKVGDLPQLAGSISAGDTVEGRIDYSDDEDWYAITVEKGKSYWVTLETNRTQSPIYFPDASPLANPRLSVVTESLSEIAFNDDNGVTRDAAVTFKAKNDGVYYIKALGGPGNTGDFILRADEFSPPEPPSPIDALDWGVKFNKTEIRVYFAAQAETFGGETTDQPWNTYEAGQAMAALGEYSRFSQLSFTQVSHASDADFFMVKNFEEGSTTGRMIPQDPNYSPDEGVGWFNTSNTVWSRDKAGGLLEKGAYGYSNFIHEFGHGLGLSHPHDNGGTSAIFAGVTGSGDKGENDLNQEVFTVMSYNKGWQTGPNGGSGTNVFGIARTPMAFDIAQIQKKYGANDSYASGKDSYALWTANQTGTGYETIWDTGGKDSIVNPGNDSATIDLRAATLKAEPGGGGYVSFVSGVFGGYTIASGVKIETAIGGGAADTLIGNRFANLLDGRGGKDIMIGGKGNDKYVLSQSDDVVSEFRKGGTDMVIARDFDIDLKNYKQVENARIKGKTDLDLSGSKGANKLLGNGGDNVISGKGGGDVLDGKNGADRLDGAGGQDTLKGKGGDDRLIGGGKSDTLDGGSGDNILTGGKGRDVFVFKGKLGSNDITDFEAGRDALHLSQKLWQGKLNNASVVDDFADLIGGEVLFDFGGGAQIHLAGVSSLDWLAGDIVLI
ncbi:M10 family metallopeptidase [Heliomarina baculiformis]|uniref:M10 family metallopeptidase n=1 Tax=Heliomarina baculiformis TaxID=2872036 RepID=UPI001EE2CBAA|nr:M10 family metallopeptidase [Heliomarina baculiformis]